MDVEIVLPTGALGPSDSDDLLDSVLRLIALAAESASEDRMDRWGTSKYGARFENDVFLMKPYCWCEAEDCLWCGGSSCQGDIPREPHRDGCYRRRLDDLKRELGELTDSWSGDFKYWHVPYRSKNTAKYNRAKRKLCRDLGVSYESGNEVHCTCGVDQEHQARYDACDCDWHKGRGRYRFGAAVEAPNFWYKPTNLQVRWYKYIGRSMEINRALERTELLEILTGSLASVSVARGDAERLLEEAAQDGQEMMTAVMRSVGCGEP